MDQQVLTLEAGDYTVILRDASPLGDPIPELDLPFAAEYGDWPHRLSARYVVECWAGAEKLRACLLKGWNGGGATGVHEHAAFVHDDRCIVGIMADLVALQIPSLDVLWHTQADEWTCFEVFHLPEHRCYISHGEVDISRVDYDGHVLWRSGGKDIFTNGFEINADHVIAVDFNYERYHIDLETGKSRIIP